MIDEKIIEKDRKSNYLLLSTAFAAGIALISFSTKSTKWVNDLITAFTGMFALIVSVYSILQLQDDKTSGGEMYD
jgi:CHASE2 domain-containing sensor protein